MLCRIFFWVFQFCEPWNEFKNLLWSSGQTISVFSASNVWGFVCCCSVLKAYRIKWMNEAVVKNCLRFQELLQLL